MQQEPPREEVLQALAERKLTLAVAEGDTGGLLLAQLTAVPGSSAVVLGGVVPYADSLKRAMLGLSGDVLAEHGAVSAAAAEAMALGIRRVSGADVGVATTGVAGPGGGTPRKPVGRAFVAVALSSSGAHVREHQWHGDRAANRQSSADAALALLLEVLKAECSENDRHA